ncbi:MAG: hypothetical protein PHU40_08095 [Sulfurimonas sp.]|nr:hypothetical protein [Sulfurimonas sp.]
MGIVIIDSLIVLYIFVLYKSFNTKVSQITSMRYFKLANFNGKVILAVSLLVLAALLIIHGGVYWGISLFATVFSFLGFLSHVPLDERIETYIEQVVVISIFILLPYAKYSYSVVQKFKVLLFDHLLEKYNANIEIIKDKSFPVLNNFIFTNNDFLHQVERNLASTDLKYFSQNNIDDTFYFPEKNIYVTECTLDIIEKRYKIDSKGKGRWKRTQQESLFNGLVIILPKEKYNPDSKVSEPTFFRVDNTSASISTEANRALKKHNIILELFYTYYFRKSNDVTYDNDNFTQELFEHFDKELQNYAQQNESINAIAQKMNINYIMEDGTNIYLFHKENSIDLFTLYQNQSVDGSLETFENDFKLLLEITQEF